MQQVGFEPGFGDGGSGIGDPRALSDSIGTTLVSTATGLFVFPFGIIVLTISLVLLFKRPTPAPPPLPARE